MKLLVFLTLFLCASARPTQLQAAEHPDSTTLALYPSYAAFGSPGARYRLYPCVEKYCRYTIKLDTKTGRLWVICNFGPMFQDIPDNEVPLDDVDKTDGREDGHFTLYPSHYPGEFILLDEEGGDVYSVRWSGKLSTNSVKPILER